MLVLFETAAGFALFKVLQEGKLKEATDLWQDFSSIEAAESVVKLKAFDKFENTTEALAAASSLLDGKLSKGLKKFLKKNATGDTMAVADSKLGSIVKEKLGIPCIYNNAVLELNRGIRAQLAGLVSGLGTQDLTPMSLGLSHSLSRYKLKFSPDKVDTMIVQAIGLLDDLDKELNTYAMRVREWYGWHFPEMTKIVTDNVTYAKVVKLMGTREAAPNVDFSNIQLDQDVEDQVREAAVVSMGTEISLEDMTNIVELCDQVIALADYRGQLYDYLKARMAAIAPNLTVLVGELVGARLIAHAGSLINLAKVPASTVQILGAEKALFRALKAKHDTPKYGLIYHASLVGQAAPKFKGKVSRVLAAKASLSTRVDALGDEIDGTLGLAMRAQVEARLRQMEGRLLAVDSSKPRGQAPTPKYDPARQGASSALLTEPAGYNTAADVTMDAAATQKPKKKKRKLIEELEPAVAEPEAEPEANGDAAAPSEAPAKKKKKKAKAAEAAAAAEVAVQAAAEALLEDTLGAPAADALEAEVAVQIAAEALLEDALGAPAAEAPEANGTVSSEGKPKKKKKKQAALAAAEAAAPVAAAIAEVAASLPNGDASPAAVPVQKPKKKKRKAEAL